nr:hypothetical protein [Fodinicola feengrottensis]
MDGYSGPVTGSPNISAYWAAPAPAARSTASMFSRTAAGLSTDGPLTRAPAAS